MPFYSAEKSGSGIYLHISWILSADRQIADTGILMNMSREVTWIWKRCCSYHRIHPHSNPQEYLALFLSNIIVWCSQPLIRRQRQTSPYNEYSFIGTLVGTCFFCFFENCSGPGVRVLKNGWTPFRIFWKEKMFFVHSTGFWKSLSFALIP